MAKLSSHELLNIIESYEKDSIGENIGELSGDRAEAIRRYYGEPYGDELEGRSQVISRDFADAVDWIMPSLMRIFMTTDFLSFDPVEQNDEEAARQETDYVNHVIMKENNAFIVLHDWFKDALMLRNGYVKTFWDETEDTTIETYTDITIEALAYINQQKSLYADSVDVLEQEAKPSIDPLTGMPVELYDIKLRCTSKKGRVKIDPVSPDEIRVSNRTRGDLRECVFFQHVARKTRTELIEMGLGKKFVYDLPTYSYSSNESQERQKLADEKTLTNENKDKSTDEIEYKETYVMVDYDQDGKSELRRVVVVGDKIPEAAAD